MYQKKKGFAFITAFKEKVAENRHLNQILESKQLYNYPKGLILNDKITLRVLSSLFSFAESISGYKFGLQPKLAKSIWCVLTLADPVPDWQQNYREADKYFFTLLTASYPEGYESQKRSLVDATKLELLVTESKESSRVFPQLATVHYIYTMRKKQLIKVAELLAQHGQKIIERESRTVYSRDPFCSNYSAFMILSRHTGIPLANKNMNVNLDPDLLSSLVSACLLNLNINPTGIRPYFQLGTQGLERLQQTFDLKLNGIEVFIENKKINIAIIENDHLITVFYDVDPDIPYTTWKSKLDELYKELESSNIDITDIDINKIEITRIATQIFDF